MKIIYIVTYIDHDTIEGYVQNNDDFMRWLKEHNKRRAEEGNIKEDASEFKLTEVRELV